MFKLTQRIVCDSRYGRHHRLNILEAMLTWLQRQLFGGTEQVIDERGHIAFTRKNPPQTWAKLAAPIVLPLIILCFLVRVTFVTPLARRLDPLPYQEGTEIEPRKARAKRNDYDLGFDKVSNASSVDRQLLAQYSSSSLPSDESLEKEFADLNKPPAPKPILKTSRK